MKIIAPIIDAIRTARFFIRITINEGLKNPFKRYNQIRTKPLYLLANGPSLNDFLKEVDENPEKYAGQDYSVVNDFVNNSHFELLKPKYCVMSDPLFFIDTIYAERGHKAMTALADKVTWPLILIIPYQFRMSPFLLSLKDNSNITILTFHSQRYYGAEKFRNFFYGKGLGNGEFGTVALNALYSGIMMGYKTIYLYGIDHTFFDNLIVNDKNELCHIERHFYETNDVLKPILNHYMGMSVVAKPFRVSDFLFEKANIFKGHEIINSFARYMDASVFNCTKNSMVDEYKRIN